MTARTAVLRAPRSALILMVRVYQMVVSPMTQPSCRFYPSCSHYAVVALERHGLFRGGWLAVRRLGRCHPWTAGGIDDVPAARETRAVPDQHAERARSSTR